MFSNLPSLNALRAFEAVARHRSYTRAAKELHVTPAAVKQLVTKLEAALGQPLIIRQGQRLVPSEPAIAGQGHVESGLRQMTLAVEAMRPAVTRRRLTVSADPFFAATWLVPRLTRFRDLHPAFDVLIDSTMEICDLTSGDADIAIRYGVTKADNLHRIRLFEDRIMPVFSPRLIDGPPHLHSIEDLRRAPLLHWDLSSTPWARATAHWFSFDTWFKLSGVYPPDPARNMHFTDYNLAVQAAIAGQGVVLGSWPVLRAAIEAGLLVAPFGQPIDTDIGYDLVTLPASRHKAAVEDFCNWLCQEARSEPSWIEFTSRSHG